MPLLPFIQALAGPLLGSLGQGIQTKVNADIARENTDKTIAANKALAEYQYSKDVEMWNRGNAYNSPLAQMERLKNAGLNPNMVYGSGNAAGMSTGQLPKYNAPTVSYSYQPPVDIPSMIAQFQDFRIKNAQVRNTEEMFKGRELSNMLAQETQADKILGVLQDTRLKGARADIEGDKALYSNALFRSQSQFAQGRLRSLSLEQDKLIAATKNLDLQNDYFAAKQISNLLGGGVTALKGIQSMFRGGKGALSPKTLSLPTQRKMKSVPSGISPNEWYNRLGYGN